MGFFELFILASEIITIAVLASIIIITIMEKGKPKKDGLVFMCLVGIPIAYLIFFLLFWGQYMTPA
jgi:hypothetical protein